MIVHGLIVHSEQPGDGGVQLTEGVMSAGPLGWVQLRITVSHDCVDGTTLVGARRSTENTEIHIMVSSY